MVRITKGLLTKFYPNYDYSNDLFTVRFPPLTETPEEFSVFASIVSQMRFDSKGEGVIRFRHVVMNRCGNWILQFYNSPYFQVGHLHADSLKNDPISL